VEVLQSSAACLLGVHIQHVQDLDQCAVGLLACLLLAGQALCYVVFNHLV
jgi:hypothetical protein